MKFLHFLLILVFLAACNDSNQETPVPVAEETPIIEENPVIVDGNLLTIKASGLNSSVILHESISELNYEINTDGIHDIYIPPNQSVYDFEIVYSNQQSCIINGQLELVCESPTACSANYKPVCAKKPFIRVACNANPCPPSQYLSYSNACHAISENARIAISSECETLQGIHSVHRTPVQIINLAIINTFSHEFDVISSNIVDDTLTVEFEVSGGCGSHSFYFLADEVFFESNPVQLSTQISHFARDSCDGLIRIEKKFDLLPIKEIYRRTYPRSQGENSIILNNFGTHFLGTYSFELN